jgi:hypothetical protein
MDCANTAGSIVPSVTSAVQRISTCKEIRKKTNTTDTKISGMNQETYDHLLLTKYKYEKINTPKSNVVTVAMNEPKFKLTNNYTLKQEIQTTARMKHNTNSETKNNK